MPIRLAVPVLRVADVARSIEWYGAALEFVADPFPPSPPHEFAILRQGESEVMLRRSRLSTRSKSAPYDWDVYLRLERYRFRALYEQLCSRGIVTRRLERMFYGLSEFEITDPDGYVVCLSQFVEDASDLPTPNA